MLIFLTSLYIIFYGGSKPHVFKRRRQIEVFNEWMIMVMNYHLVAFSEFNMNTKAQYNMGYSYVFMIGVVIAVNLSFMFVKMYHQFQKKRALYNLRKA